MPLIHKATQAWVNPLAHEVVWALKDEGGVDLILTEGEHPSTRKQRHYVNLTKPHILIGNGDSGQMEIQIETIIRGEGVKLAQPVNKSISPALAEFLVAHWGYRVRFLKPGVIVRTDKNGTARVFESHPRGRYHAK